jgi:hypothetical protein
LNLQSSCLYLLGLQICITTLGFKIGFFEPQSILFVHHQSPAPAPEACTLSIPPQIRSPLYS